MSRAATVTPSAVKAPAAPRLTRRVLEALPKTSLHQARNWSKADVMLAEWPPQSGRQVVIKDFRQRALWFRVLAARHILRREWSALRALRGIEGVPQPIARPDADCIVMEFLTGEPATGWRDGTLPDEAIRNLDTLVKALHARGVIHGDLHQDNILVHEDNTISLIDWATAGSFGRHPTAAKKFIFEEWCALDERAVAKLKVLHAVDLVTEREHDLLVNGGSRLYRAIKKLRRSADRLRGKQNGERAAVLRKYIEQTKQMENNS